MKDLSIIIPIYNASLTDINRCINSISFNSLYNIECIIVDDSDDNSAYDFFNCKLLLNNNNFIYIRNTVRRGIGESLNIGIHIARADYIMRLDIDDFNMPGRIESQLEFIKRNNFDVVGTVYRNNLYKKIKYPKYDFYIKLMLSFINPIIHPSVIMKKDIFKVFSYSNYRYCEDLDLWLRLRNKGYKFCNIDDNLITYSKNFFIRQNDNWLKNIRVRIGNLRINYYLLPDILGIIFVLCIYFYSTYIFLIKNFLKKMHH